MADESKKTNGMFDAPKAPELAPPPPPAFTPEQEKMMADLTARKAASPLSQVEEKQLADMQARKKAMEAPAVKEVAIPHGPIRVAKEAELAAKKKMMADLPEQIAALEAELKPQPPVACIPLAMGATCPACGYVRHEGNLEPHPVA